MQGTRVLVVENWWPSILKHEELAPLWSGFADATFHTVPEAVKRLHKIGEGRGLNQIEAYNLATEKLEGLYSLSDVPRQRFSTVQWLLAWPIQLRSDYLGLLGEKRPEALVILAYYGTLLHFYNRSWVVGETGRRLVQALGEYLGPEWKDWMQWPSEMVSSD